MNVELCMMIVRSCASLVQITLSKLDHVLCSLWHQTVAWIQSCIFRRILIRFSSNFAWLFNAHVLDHAYNTYIDFSCIEGKEVTHFISGQVPENVLLIFSAIVLATSVSLNSFEKLSTGGGCGGWWVVGGGIKYQWLFVFYSALCVSTKLDA